MVFIKQSKPLATGAKRPVDAEKDVAVQVTGDIPEYVDPLVTARAIRKIDIFLIPAMIIGCRSWLFFRVMSS